MKKRILIVDDHFVVRAGTTLILESKFHDLLVDEAENYAELLEKLKLNVYDIIILDINMPGSKQVAMISEIKNIQEFANILVFSAYEDSIALQYIKEGASGYLNKLCPESELIIAVESILETGKYYSEAILKNMMEVMVNKNFANPINKLTSNEYKIFELIVNGNGNIEISNSLNLHPSTVSTYKSRILKKLNAKTITELFNIYRENTAKTP